MILILLFVYVTVFYSTRAVPQSCDNCGSVFLWKLFGVLLPNEFSCFGETASSKSTLVLRRETWFELDRTREENKEVVFTKWG